MSVPDSPSPSDSGLEHAAAVPGGDVASRHLPWFITLPASTDYLFMAMAALVIGAIIAIGNLFFKLHALPERWAHDANPLQVELIGVLSLIALFTHQHIFWLAALLLALVRVPDFASPLQSMADSLAGLARRPRRTPHDDRVSRSAGADLSPDRIGGGA